ncbi:hypothetical protein P691DRAFT_669404 [Macrolepiota fuliginosa MF-IS2]|uniref:DUF6534 domain-containing protein n=1 Tax=Macrolepiota fuliginosa MF-IS2 TaxID=1400762 RepID=A0A9P6C470_9AGAR|nr:hypothetical protein P691DRAFT_669404 [Macrolepiota fuliginosa MF-IS2]
MTPEEFSLVQFLLGPWLVGCFLDVFLQGILFCQFSRYVSHHEGDKLGIKLAVFGLAILTTLKSVQSFALVWIQFIQHFADVNGAILLNYTAWWQTGNALMVATIGAYVQVYFCHRLYVVSGFWWVVAPVALILAFAYASICAATYYISLGAAAGPKIALWFAAHLSSVFAGDIAMSVTMAFFLIRTKREVLPQTVGIIQALIRLTFLTAAPAALCAMFNLIFSQVYSGDDKLISTAFNQILPKLYAMSMMWTLNARQGIREKNSRNYSSDYTSGGQRRAGVSAISFASLYPTESPLTIDCQTFTIEEHS